MPLNRRDRQMSLTDFRGCQMILASSYAGGICTNVVPIPLSLHVFFWYFYAFFLFSFFFPLVMEKYKKTCSLVKIHNMLAFKRANKYFLHPEDIVLTFCLVVIHSENLFFVFSCRGS